MILKLRISTETEPALWDLCVLKSHTLTELGTHFCIEYLAHDALEDSRTCGQIIKLAADRLALLTVIIRAILLIPVVITAVLLAGTLSLLVSWTSEQKKHQIKENKNALNYIVFIIMRNSSMSLEAIGKLNGRLCSCIKFRYTI